MAPRKQNKDGKGPREDMSSEEGLSSDPLTPTRPLYPQVPSEYISGSKPWLEHHPHLYPSENICINPEISIINVGISQLKDINIQTSHHTVSTSHLTSFSTAKLFSLLTLFLAVSLSVYLPSPRRKRRWGWYLSYCDGEYPFFQNVFIQLFT